MNRASPDEDLLTTSRSTTGNEYDLAGVPISGPDGERHEKDSGHHGSLLLVAFGFSDAAWAQIPQYNAGPQTGGGGPTLKRSTRPVVSAYTGLLGAGVGSNSGIGYQFFTRVQPQIAAGRAIGSLGNSVNRLQATQSLASGGLSN